MPLQEGSIVFPPGFAAFGAAEESNLALIRASKLPEPPVCIIIAAIRTAGVGGGKTRGFLLQYGHNPIKLLGLADHRSARGFGNLMAALSADHHATFWHHHAFALGTKLHRSMSNPLVILKFPKSLSLGSEVFGE
jgi:hypothetical protein